MGCVGRVAIVTGGAKGIGKAIACELAKEGAIVCAVDIDDQALEVLQQEHGVFGIRGDVSLEEDCRRIVEDACQHGDLCGLVNNAGIGIAGAGHVRDATMDAFDRVLGVNLRGTFMMSKFASARMTRPAWIVNIASTRYLQSEPLWEAYACSKGGIVALTHALAASLGPQGVRVNAIAPGWIDVSTWRPGGDQAILTAEDHAQHMVGRVGVPFDIAQACVYLAKAGFVTGQVLVVDGGMTKKMIYVE